MTHSIFKLGLAMVLSCVCRAGSLQLPSCVYGMRPTQLARPLQCISAYPTHTHNHLYRDDTAGTGPAFPPIDSSVIIAEQLFAPFSEDLFSAELDIHALQKMLTQPLTTQIPVASNIYTQYCSLMPTLYRSSTTENARGLISRFDSALAQSWPTGSGSELNYTGFWDTLGFKLPEFAQQYIDCGVSCSR